jgi:phenylpropionate dioxygenase-like ring-hydroxylating dioxygenase large terminal subunit
MTALPVLCGNPALDVYWYVVAADADLSDGPIGVGLLGRRYVLWRDPTGEVVAAPDVCPHRQAKLSDGTVEGGTLACPYHGWSFAAGGRCVLVPSSGPGSAVPPRAHLAPVRTVTRYGLIWLCPGEPAADVPTIVEDDDPSYRRLNVGLQVWRCSVTRMVDNFLDYSHFAFVHRDSIGKGLDPKVGPMTVEELGGSFVGYSFEHDIAADGVGGGGHGSATAEPNRMTTSTAFSLPFLIRGSMSMDHGPRQALMLCSTPVDDETSYFTFVIWRNEHEIPAQELTDFELNIDDEDRRMLESLDGPLPLDPVTLVNVQSDKASVEWRRRLRAVLEAPGAPAR